MEFPDETYRDICCIKTLYSTQEGFFNDFVNVIFEKVESSWIDGVFKSQKTPLDKVKLCCTDSKVWSAVQEVLQNVKKIYRKKCSEAAKSSREEADMLFKAGDYKKAVMMYSQSIIRAPLSDGDKSPDGYSLPLAYKGRANALFHLQDYQECLTDLNMALKEGFPSALKYQVFRQMGECYKELVEPNKAQISLQVALKLIEDQILKLETTVVKHGTSADKGKDEMLKKLLNQEREQIKKISEELPQLEGEEKQEGARPITAQYIGGPLPKVKGAVNEKYPKASNLVTIKQSVGAGRFAVAAEHIDTGATLVVEEPQASVLIPQMLSSHCLHCFTRLYTPVPCKLCSGVAFCSVKCRNAATSSYHKYECEFLGLFLGSGMSVLSHLAFRMITQESLQFFKQLQAKIDSLKSNKDSESIINFSERESQYMHVFNLMTHSHLRTGKDYFRRTLMAIFLVKCLKETTYFGKTENAGGSPFSEDEIQTAATVLHHLELLQFNAHEMYETRVVRPGQTREAKAQYIAVGIFPTVALFNHECAPSVTRYFNGKNIVIRAVRPLEKNEILSENYGPHYAKKILYERIRELTSRYWFRCECKACEEDWPLVDKLTDEDFKIRCRTPNCRGVFLPPRTSKSSETNPICQYCLKKTNVVDALKLKAKIQILFDKGIDYMDNQSSSKAVPLLASYLDEIYQLGVPPCREMFLCQEALRTCYAQTGNVWVLNE